MFLWLYKLQVQNSKGDGTNRWALMKQNLLEPQLLIISQIQWPNIYPFQELIIMNIHYFVNTYFWDCFKVVFVLFIFLFDYSACDFDTLFFKLTLPPGTIQVWPSNIDILAKLLCHG